MKRIYITLGVLLAAMIAMAYLYFSNLKTETGVNDLSLNAATANAGILFSFENDKSFYEILASQDLLENLLGETKSKQLSSLRKNLIAIPAIENAIEGQKVYVSINNTADFLITTQLKPAFNLKKTLELLKSNAILVKSSGAVHELTFPDSTTVFVGIKGSLIALSSNRVNISPALNNQAADKKFIDYVKNNSRFNKNTLANLYINYNQIPALLKNILNSNLIGELSIFNKQNSYAAFSYNFSKENLLFSGTTDLNNDLSYETLFASLPAANGNIENILPQATANYITYHFGDYQKWGLELRKWFEKRKELEKIDQQLSSIELKYRLNLKQNLPKYFKDEMVTFQLNTGEKFGAIAILNGEKLNQLLLDLSSEYTPEVRIFKEANLPYSFFGMPMQKFERPFYTIIDNYLVMANNASSIESFLAKYRNDQLLINDRDFASFREQLPSAASILYYVNNKNSNEIFGRNLKMPYFKQYQSKKGFKSYYAFGYQLSGDNGKFLSNLLLSKKQQVQVDSLATK